MNDFSRGEGKLRRQLAKLGYRLMKVRRGHPLYRYCGGYQVVDPGHGGVVFGYGPFGFTADLDDLAEFVADHYPKHDIAVSGREGPGAPRLRLVSDRAS